MFYSLAYEIVIVRTFSLCRVREIVFEKKRETLLLIGRYFISKAVKVLFFKLIRLTH